MNVSAFDGKPVFFFCDAAAAAVVAGVWSERRLGGSRWSARHLALRRWEGSFDGFDLHGEQINYAVATHQAFLLHLQPVVLKDVGNKKN